MVSNERLEKANTDRQQIGILGAGTMGSGIALTALLADFQVVLYDINQEMLDRARQYIEKHLERKQQTGGLSSLSLTTSLETMREAGVVIEAAPEDLPIKQGLFARLESICGSKTIFASNTSTLPITAIASAVGTPWRVAGMHFFNPAPVLPLVEVVRGAQTSPETVQALVELAQEMGKTPVVARDTPGFIVNRVARPFYGEALRLLGEGVASVEQIDQIVRQGGGFPMGPFALMDLIGIDVNLAATRSVYEQTFHEPRFRPHIIQEQMVQQKALGRKTGRGFYTYAGESEQEEESPPSMSVQPGQAVIFTDGTWTPEMQAVCEQAGYEILSELTTGPSHKPSLKVQVGIVSSGSDENASEDARRLDLELPPSVPLFVQCADVTAAEVSTWVEHPDRVVGFDGLFFANGPVATLCPGPLLNRTARFAADTFVRTLGRVPVWIQDSPALVLPRIVCMLSNEAAFAVGEGVADPETIDQAMRLGTSYPKGPLAWASEIGPCYVTAVLEHLQNEYGEERYRVAPVIRRMAYLDELL